MSSPVGACSVSDEIKPSASPVGAVSAPVPVSGPDADNKGCPCEEDGAEENCFVCEPPSDDDDDESH